MTDEELVICKLHGMNNSTIEFIEKWMEAKQCSLQRILDKFGIII